MNKGKTCSLSMENQLELDEASPFSDAFCSSYQLPKEDVDDGMVVTDLRLLMIELVSNEYYGTTFFFFLRSKGCSLVDFNDKFERVLFTVVEIQKMESQSHQTRNPRE